MLCTVLENMWHDLINYFDQDMGLVMLKPWKNKPNMSKKSKNISFSLHATHRGLGFHLYLFGVCRQPKLHT